MAWRSSGTTNADLVNKLVSNKLIKSERVKAAMLKVDRAYYAPAEPYHDSPQPIGFSATISAPHMHAHACESLLPFLSPSSRVLDVGSGSGYLTHVLAELVSPEGKVVGVDHIKELVELAVRNTNKSDEGRTLLEKGHLMYAKADGRLGFPDQGLYDAIHVGAAAKEIHQDLIDQLKAPGRLFIPVEENHMQHIWILDKKSDSSITKQKLYGVSYVPLTDEPK